MASILRNVIKSYSNQQVRYFTPTSVKNDKITTSSATQNGKPGVVGSNMHKVSNFQKRILVWVGKYKTVEEIPKLLPGEIIEKASSRARIRIANYMMAATALACLVMIISGKRAAERGETVQKANVEWHRRVKEEEEKRKGEKSS